MEPNHPGKCTVCGEPAGKPFFDQTLGLWRHWELGWFKVALLFLNLNFSVWSFEVWIFERDMTT